MRRLGFGLGFCKGASFFDGGTEIFPSNVAEVGAGKNFVLASDYASLKITGDISFGAWVYPTSYSDGFIISKNDGAGTEAFRINTLVDGSVTALISHDGAYGSIVFVQTGASAIPLNQWSHVYATYDQVDLTLYIDGVSIGDAPSTSPIFDASLPMYVGRLAGGAEGAFVGQMHSDTVSPRAHTPAEVAVLASSPAKCLDLIKSEMPSLADILYFLPAYNHAGFVGKELVNQGTDATLITTNVGATFTGSADIECNA